MLKAYTISAHLQLPRETKTIQTEIVEFCEMGENNELSSQVPMRAVLADNGGKCWKNAEVIALTEALRVRYATDRVLWLSAKEKL